MRPSSVRGVSGRRDRAFAVLEHASLASKPLFRTQAGLRWHLSEGVAAGAQSDISPRRIENTRRFAANNFLRGDHDARNFPRLGRGRCRGAKCRCGSRAPRDVNLEQKDERSCIGGDTSRMMREGAQMHRACCILPVPPPACRIPGVYAGAARSSLTRVSVDGIRLGQLRGWHPPSGFWSTVKFDSQLDVTVPSA